MHIIIDILHSFNLRNCSCFRFWVFCLVFCLRKPRRGFFIPFPARYAHILSAYHAETTGIIFLPFSASVLFDNQFFLGYIFFFADIKCIQYRVF